MRRPSEHDTPKGIDLPHLPRNSLCQCTASAVRSVALVSAISCEQKGGQRPQVSDAEREAPQCGVEDAVVPYGRSGEAVQALTVR